MQIFNLGRCDSSAIESLSMLMLAHAHGTFDLRIEYMPNVLVWRSVKPQFALHSDQVPVCVAVAYALAFLRFWFFAHDTTFTIWAIEVRLVKRFLANATRGN